MNTLKFCYFPTKGYPPPPPPLPPSSMSLLAQRFINLGLSPTQKPLCVLGRLEKAGDGEEWKRAWNDGKGKEWKRSCRLFFLPIIHRALTFFFNFFFKCCHLYWNTQQQPLRRKGSSFRAVNTFRVVRLGCVTEMRWPRRPVKTPYSKETEKVKKGFLSK